jgi:tRNA/tmRNA/rRNA uracil-C5-methylase (TrmA/RlmC/RlmD family)
VGLFGGAIADRLGPGGRVDVVEGDRTAAADAAANLLTVETAHIHHAPVDRFLAKTPLRRCDLVVLDPPRAGAGKSILDRVTRLRPRAISYVACDPAALGRDVAYLRDLGYDMGEIRAFDLFPMTHHVECVALFHPRSEVVS